MALRSDEFIGEIEALDGEWGTRNDRRVVQEFDDPDAAYWGIRRDGAGLVDRSERETVVLEGSETIPWLQGLITSDLMELVDEGSGQWTCVPDVNGRMVADLRVLHLPGMLVLDLEPGTLESGLIAHFRQQLIMEDVDIHDRTSSTGRLGVFGPESARILREAGRWRDDPGQLGEFDGTWGEVAGIEVIVQSMPVTGGPGYDLSFDRSASHRIWEAVRSAGGERLDPAGEATMETLRIEAGVPRFGVETSREIIPLEANLEPLVSFEKGCYVGQEIIARLDTRGTPAKRLRTLVFEGGAAPAVGAELSGEGRSPGSVVSSTWSPLLDKPIALAYVKRNYNDIGTELEVEGRTARVEEAGYPLREGRSVEADFAG